MSALNNLTAKILIPGQKVLNADKFSDKGKVIMILDPILTYLATSRGREVIFHGPYYVSKAFTKCNLFMNHLEVGTVNLEDIPEIAVLAENSLELSKASGMYYSHSQTTSDGGRMCSFSMVDRLGKELCKFSIDKLDYFDHIVGTKISSCEVVGFSLEQSVAEMYMDMLTADYKYREEALYMFYMLTELYDINVETVYNMMMNLKFYVVSGDFENIQEYMVTSSRKLYECNGTECTIPTLEDKIERVRDWTTALLDTDTLMWRHSARLFEKM